MRMGTTPHSINHHGREEVEHSTRENHLEQGWMERSRPGGEFDCSVEKSVDFSVEYKLSFIVQ